MLSVLTIGSVAVLGGMAGLLVSVWFAPSILRSAWIRHLVEYIGNIDVGWPKDSRPEETKGTAGVVQERA